jgi:predicted nucleotidyltransferase
MKKKYKTAIEALRRSLRNELGTALKDVIVFGSVAREKDTADSDIDVMVVLDLAGTAVDWHTEKQVRSIAFDVELEQGVVFDIKVLDRAALQRAEGHTPFVENVFAEGVRA